MSRETRLKVAVDADVRGLTDGMNEAANAVGRASDRITDAVNQIKVGIGSSADVINARVHEVMASHASLASQMKVLQADFTSDANTKKGDLAYERQTGQISASDAAAQPKAIEKAKTDAMLAALKERAQLGNLRIKEQQDVENRILQLQRQSDLQKQQIQRQSNIAMAANLKAFIAPIDSTFQASVRGIIMGTQTLQQGLSRIYGAILNQFIGMATSMVTEWIGRQVAMTIFGEAQSGLRKTAETTAAAEASTASAVQAIGSIGNDAARAGAAAFASTAAIPVVGPAMAPGAAAAAYGGAMTFAGSVIPFAAGGYDVPADTLAFIHRKEMVLPAELADRVRGMTDSSGGSGTNVHIHAVDADSMVRLFKRNPNALAAGLKVARRNFVPHAR